MLKHHSWLLVTILDVNREAWLSLKGAAADERVVLGATQDFADSTLPTLLRAFVRTHPRVRLDLGIGRTLELTKGFEEGAIDLLLVMRRELEPDEIAIVREQMAWLISESGLATNSREVPLALLDPPCGFRSVAITALDGARRPYRIAASSGSLSGLAAAVRGGIAVTLRTPRLIGNGIIAAPAALELPVVPAAEFSLRQGRNADEAAKSLAELISDGLQAGPVSV
jgi:DNA-binding transcriptional LysR family regulator